MANEKLKDKLIKVFGMEPDDDQYEYDDAYEEEEEVEVEEIKEQPRSGFTPKIKKTTPTPRRSSLGLGDGPEVLVLEPEFIGDAPGIVNKLKLNKTVVVNLKNAEIEEAHKIFDFLNGALFALDGSINHIADNVFILAPEQVSVSTTKTMEKDKDEIITPILNWDGDK